jgi:hypothetical protein
VEKKNLNSSSIRTVTYDKEHKLLVILFQSGGIYSYEGVPEEVYKTLITTMSPGVFFVSNIRDVYPVQCMKPTHTEKKHGAGKTEDKAQAKGKAKTKNAQV